MLGLDWDKRNPNQILGLLFDLILLLWFDFCRKLINILSFVVICVDCGLLFSFAGNLYPVNERATRTIRNLYVENERVIFVNLQWS